MKRREPLNLTHVLEDRAISVPVVEKRIHTRFDKAFLVVIGSELYGDSYAIARNVSAGGILVEMSYAPPLGTVVTVHFQNKRDDDHIDEIVARAEVKHHHYLNFSGPGPRNDAGSARAIGLRFLEFIDAQSDAYGVIAAGPATVEPAAPDEPISISADRESVPTRDRWH